MEDPFQKHTSNRRSRAELNEQLQQQNDKKYINRMRKINRIRSFVVELPFVGKCPASVDQHQNSLFSIYPVLQNEMSYV